MRLAYHVYVYGNTEIQIACTFSESRCDKSKFYDELEF